METPAKKKSFISQWINYTADAGGMVAAVCLLGVTCIVALEVVMRYVFNSPTTWVSETSVYLCMAIGLLGAAFALKNDSHFSITIVIDRLTPKNRRRMKIVTHLMGLAYSAVFVYKGAAMARFSYDIEDVSTGLMEVPLWIPWLLVPIGGLLLCLQFINKLAGEIKK